MLGDNMPGQETAPGEKFGQTLNAGTGFGYYRYVGYPVPVMHADYEFQIDRNFTLVPFVTIYAYHSNYFGATKVIHLKIITIAKQSCPSG
jgi:hypothetical protein